MSAVFFPKPFVTSGASVAAFNARHLPDNPIARFDDALRCCENFRRFVENLQRLAVQPFGRDDSAVTREPFFIAFARERVDAVSVTLRGVMFPKFHPSVRMTLPLARRAKRRAVGKRRQNRA